MLICWQTHSKVHLIFCRCLNQQIYPPALLAPQGMLIVILASMVGFILAGAAAYLIEYLDRSIKTTSDVERIFHFPVIGYMTMMAENGNNATYVSSHPEFSSG